MTQILDHNTYHDGNKFHSQFTKHKSNTNFISLCTLSNTSNLELFSQFIVHTYCIIFFELWRNSIFQLKTCPSFHYKSQHKFQITHLYKNIKTFKAAQAKSVDSY